MAENIILTPEIIAIMEQAGISECEIKQMANVVTVKKVSSRKKYKGIKAQEYILETTRHCKLCGTETKLKFYMHQNEDHPGLLESGPITDDTPEGLTVQTRYKVWKTCSHCVEYLASLDKEMLVAMIMAQHARREVWK